MTYSSSCSLSVWRLAPGCQVLNSGLRRGGVGWEEWGKGQHKQRGHGKRVGLSRDLDGLAEARVEQKGSGAFLSGGN